MEAGYLMKKMLFPFFAISYFLARLILHPVVWLGQLF